MEYSNPFWKWTKKIWFRKIVENANKKIVVFFIQISVQFTELNIKFQLNFIFFSFKKSVEF